MRKQCSFWVVSLFLIGFAYPAYGQNSPIEPGTEVAISTMTGTCVGAFVKISGGLIEIQESDRSEPTFVPLVSAAMIRPIGKRVRRGRILDALGNSNKEFFNRVTKDLLSEQPDAASAMRMSSLVEEIEEALLPPDDTLETIDRDQHYIFGKPKVEDRSRFRFTPEGFNSPVEGYAEYEKRAFTIGHFERFKVPAWVAMKWSRDDLRSSSTFDRDDFRFDVDLQVPSYAIAPTSLRHSTYGFERGHMARNKDLYSFGFAATQDGFLMSNIVPQQQPGHGTWGHLENEHRNIVGARSDISEVWVVSGPIFRNNEPLEVIRSSGKKVGAPHATYKVIGWFTGDEFHCRGYIIDQEDDIDRPDLGLAIRAVDTIEELTGLNFFSEIPDDQEDVLESKVHARLWDDAPVIRREGVSISSLLPNPFGTDENREFVKLSNSTDERIRLNGWSLRDRQGNTFDLSSFFINRRSTFEIRLRNTEMQLDNSGDRVELLAPGGAVVAEFEYEANEVIEGQPVSR